MLIYSDGSSLVKVNLIKANYSIELLHIQYI